jgi:hypothetical protein
MKVYQTKKLYFNKWIYKIETSTPGASLIKRWGAVDLQYVCNNHNDARWRKHYTTADKEQLLEYITAVEPFLDKEMQMRAEWDTLNFYLNDYSLYKQLQRSLADWIVSVTEPASIDDVESLQEKGSLVLCNELPYNRYRYRLYLRYQMPIHLRLNFLGWLDNYPQEVKPSKGTIRWLSGKSPYLQDPFIYVNGQSQLLMVKLFLGEYVRKTEEFVLRNTVK